MDLHFAPLPLDIEGPDLSIKRSHVYIKNRGLNLGVVSGALRSLKTGQIRVKEEIIEPYFEYNEGTE